MNLCGFVLVSLMVHSAKGVTLSPCGRDNTAEVIQGQNTSFTCSGLSSGVQVEWALGVNGNVFSAGTCPSMSSGGDCTGADFGVATTPSRESNTESRLVVDPRLFNDKTYVQRGMLECQESSNRQDSCQTDYVVPAQGSCSVQTETGSSGFQVRGTCTMYGASSSRDRYGCDWYRTNQSSLVSNQTLTADTYQTGCNVSWPLNTSTDGEYSYTATLIPGRRSVTAGTVSVDRPVAPSLPTCDGGEYIPENTNVSCTCSTDNIGTPAGRLQWIKTGNPSIVLASGDYGRASLSVSQTLQRDDHQSTQFLCSVDWASEFLGPPVTFNVGYPPTQISIVVDGGQQNQTVTEHQRVSFQCQNSNGRPSPTVALVQWNTNVKLSSGPSYLTHILVATCEDSSSYVCTADNGMGPLMTSAARNLFVQCSPRGQQIIGEVNFINEPVSVSFNVTAFPAPGPPTFTYRGPSLSSTESQQIDSTQISLTGSCVAKPGVLYLSTCRVTVSNVTLSTAAGFYTVTITNTQGSAQFLLQVLPSKAIPATPDPEAVNHAPPDSPSYLMLAVGFGAALAVSITLHVIVLVWMWRRQWTLPCAGGTENGIHQSPKREEASEGVELTPVMDNPKPAAYCGPYDSPQMPDVGQGSVYSEIGHHDN